MQYEVLNKSESKEATIKVYGAIPAWDRDEQRVKNTVDSFLRVFESLEQKHDVIHVRINSPGGSIYHTMPIFNALRRSKAHIHTWDDGIAASAGGVLLQAGKTRHAPKTSFLLLHSASSYVWDSLNASRAREIAEDLDKYDLVLAEAFADLSGKSKDDILAKYFDGKDHLLTGEEAFNEGFIDILEDYKPDVPQNFDPKNQIDPAFWEKQDKTFFKRMVERVVSALKPNHSQIVNTPQMDFGKSIELLKNGALTEEQSKTVLEEIKNFTGAKEKFTTEEVNAKVKPIEDAKIAAETKVSGLEAKVEELKKEVNNLKEEKATPSAASKEGGENPNNEGEDEFVTDFDREVARMKAELE